MKYYYSNKRKLCNYLFNLINQFLTINPKFHFKTINLKSKLYTLILKTLNKYLQYEPLNKYFTTFELFIKD
jgi:hypothetical protein